MQLLCIFVLTTVLSAHTSWAQWQYQDPDWSSSPQHTCKIQSGLEPDYIDHQDCAYYWRCEDYRGILERCRGTDQFHWQYRMCMNDDDVSCYVQMEKRAHGHNYDVIDDSYSRTKECDIANGLEPNMWDEGCKSFWVCEEHHGTLHECPVGFQFDWQRLDCARDVDVICEKQMEWFYQYVYTDLVHPHPGDEDWVEEDEGEDWGGGDYDYPVVYRGEGSQLHRQDRRQVDLPSRLLHHQCEMRHGREPDHISPSCISYWLCDHHRGKLQHCPHGYRFHWQQHQCLRQEEVDCEGQRRSQGYDVQGGRGQRMRHLQQGRRRPTLSQVGAGLL